MQRNLTVWTIIVAALVSACVAFAFPSRVIETATVSSAGATFNTPKAANIVFSPTIPGATTTSILNTDASDRVIQAAHYACTGLGTSFTAYSGAGITSLGLVFTMATTSTSAPSSLGNTNYVFDTTNTIATTTAALTYLSSTTPGTTLASPINRIWLSGSYLTVSSNATNTAVCTIGVTYLPE